MTSVMKNTCSYIVDEAVTLVMERLCTAGHSIDRVLNVIGQKFLSDRLPKKTAFYKKKRAALLQFFHGVTHSLKAVCLKSVVPSVFQNHRSLCRLTPFEKTKNGAPLQ